MKLLKKLALGLTLSTLVFGTVGCGQKSAETETIKVGVVGENNYSWNYVKEELAKEKINIEIISFDDYNQPNAALDAGEIDLNAFQHQIFLDNYNKAKGTNLVSIAETVIAPLGIYSEKITDIKDLKDGAIVAIPDDVTNGGRSLRLLQTAGLINVKKEAGLTPKIEDITENPKKLQIKELAADQTARSLKDVDISIINSGLAVDAGLLPTKDSIFLEPIDASSKPYNNIIVSRDEDKDKEIFKKIIKTYQSDGDKKVIEEKSKGSSIPVW
ncbi:MAG: MetQ/NlpA family ABC transporter substrate-binding protein [Clostridioides sp.]|jgi:D-methionine transport system substrate-binding protein|nr:MetQ/NlpA family ABC transporter substrate-binding protein [Clostridioides sp.]